MPLRLLKILTVVMGVMIVAATIVLAVLIARRLSGGDHGGGASFALELTEPEGTRIAGIASLQDRLAVQLKGGGPDRVLILDPRSGRTTGRLVLRGREAAETR